MSFPLRARLALAFALGMAVVLCGLGAFLYFRIGSDLMGSLDLGLRSRAQVVVDGITRGDDSIGSPGRLIDTDESFAQVLDPAGRVVRSTFRPSGVPLLSPRDLAAIKGPASFVRKVPLIDTDPVRLLAVPADVAGAR